YIAYTTYFVFPLVVALAIYLRSIPLARRFIFLMTLTLYVSYSGYVLVPAEGPRAAISHTVPLKTTPLSRAIADTLDSLANHRVIKPNPIHLARLLHAVLPPRIFRDVIQQPHPIHLQFVALAPANPAPAPNFFSVNPKRLRPVRFLRRRVAPQHDLHADPPV